MDHLIHSMSHCISWGIMNSFFIIASVYLLLFTVELLYLQGLIVSFILDIDLPCLSACDAANYTCLISKLLCCQVALPSQAVSVSVSSHNSVPLSPLGVLVVPDGASTVRIHPRHSHLPIFWSLNESVSGDRVGFYTAFCLATVFD